MAQDLFPALGIDPARLQYEAQSRTTFENAAFTHRMIHPVAGETWLLMTSAMHMPRAVGTFRAAGLDLLPYPVGFKSFHGPVTHQYNLIDRLHLLHLAAHEWIGLAVYRLRGQSSALFPAPEALEDKPVEAADNPASTPTP